MSLDSVHPMEEDTTDLQFPTDTTIISPEERQATLNELFELISNESQRQKGLELLGFYIADIKRELLGSCNDLYFLQRQKTILAKIKQTPCNVISQQLVKNGNDLEEIVGLCVRYIYDPKIMTEPNVDILDFFINAMNTGEVGYDKVILKIRTILLDRMWKLVFVDNKLPYSIQELLLNVYPKFFNDTVNTIIDKIRKDDSDDTDLILVKIDLNYQKIVRLCQLYKNAFKLAYTSVALAMIKENIHQQLQKFLDNFLVDIKSGMKISEFQHHYQDELINDVLILSQCNDNSEMANYVLNCWWKRNYLYFVILSTNFSQFSRIFKKI